MLDCGIALPAVCEAFCGTGSGLAMPPTRGVPSQLLRFIMRPRIPTSSAASSNSVSSIASCARYTSLIARRATRRDAS